MMECQLSRVDRLGGGGGEIDVWTGEGPDVRDRVR